MDIDTGYHALADLQAESSVGTDMSTRFGGTIYSFRSFRSEVGGKDQRAVRLLDENDACLYLHIIYPCLQDLESELGRGSSQVRASEDANPCIFSRTYVAKARKAARAAVKSE